MAYLKYPNDDFLNTARGLMRNSSVRNIFGYNSLVGTTFIPGWERNTAYTYPSANLVMGVTSSNTADTAVQVSVQGLDSNYEPVSEVVTLNGTNTVNTTNKFFRINDVITVAGNATGRVSIANTGTIYAQIRPGDGRNQASIFTVPAGNAFYLNRISAFCASAALNNRTLAFRNFVTLPNGVSFRVAQTEFLEQMIIDRQYPFKYSEKSDMQFQLKGSAGSQFIGVFGEGILIDEEGTGLR